MGLFIGSIDSDTSKFSLDNSTLEEDRPKNTNDLQRIWGVVFDPEGKEITGKRLFAAQGLQFIPACKIVKASSSTDATNVTLVASNTNLPVQTTDGKDDFRLLEPDNPFDIRQVHCATAGLIEKKHTSTFGYSSSTQFYKESMSYEMTEQKGTAHSTNNTFIRFPKFYYCRPQKWEFLVSDKYLPGFLPSPMHYVDGHMYKYAYVSKYLLNYTNNATAAKVESCFGQLPTAISNDNLLKHDGQYLLQQDTGSFVHNATPKLYNTLGNFSGIYNTKYTTPAKSCMPLNYQSLCMIYFLMYIKYATMSPFIWDTEGRALSYAGDAAIAYNKGNVVTTTTAAMSTSSNTSLRGALNKIDILQTNANTNLSCYDGLVYLTDGTAKLADSVAYLTLGLAGLIGDRMFLSGAYVKDDRIYIYDLMKYYNNHRLMYNDTNNNSPNQNNQSLNDFVNYHDYIKTNDVLPLTNIAPNSIGYSTNYPWAIFPTVIDSTKNNESTRNFYLGKSGTYCRKQFQMQVNLSGNSKVYLSYMGLLPNLSNTIFGKTNVQNDAKDITSAGIRGYIVQDT